LLSKIDENYENFREKPKGKTDYFQIVRTLAENPFHAVLPHRSRPYVSIKPGNNI
jgi:hypothetical protein